MSRSVVFVVLLVVAGLSTVYSKRRQRPCQGLHKKGWGGTCFGTDKKLENNDLGRCESIIYDSTISHCRNNEACCIDCYKLNDRCTKRYHKSFASNDVCGNCPLALRLERVPKTRTGSGCHCCKECRPKRKCRGNGSRCITKHDPIYNPDWCRNKNGTHPGTKIEDRLCKGWGCHCCLIARPITTPEP